MSGSINKDTEIKKKQVEIWGLTVKNWNENTKKTGSTADFNWQKNELEDKSLETIHSEEKEKKIK